MSKDGGQAFPCEGGDMSGLRPDPGMTQNPRVKVDGRYFHRPGEDLHPRLDELINIMLRRIEVLQDKVEALENENRNR